MENKLVSVIIPTHNRTAELFRAIKSVCNQTYKNLEIIVIDDNFGRESVRTTLSSYLYEYDPRLIIIKNMEHLGGSLSRNVGIDTAKGEYVAFLDDDDECREDRIEKQLTQFHISKQSDLGLVYCFGKIHYPNGIIEDETIDNVGIPLEAHMKNNIAGTSFWLVKKEVLVAIGGFEKITSHQDGIVILKLLANNYTIDVVKEPLINYYAHDKISGITGVTKENINADYQYFKRCQEYYYLLNKKAQQRVTLHFFKDRNWNLIMLGLKNEIKKDIMFLFSKYPLSTTFFVCLLRFIFKKCVVAKEIKRLISYGLLYKGNSI
jgi:glycosyltransferase involved in cell wall biosynthesis